MMKNEDLSTLIEKYRAKGVPRKMAKMLAQTKPKKKKGGSDKKSSGMEFIKKLRKK